VNACRPSAAASIQAVAASLVAAPAFCAGTATQDQTLSEVVVVGVAPLPGSELDRDKIPAPVQFVSAADVERAHAADLTEFMKRALGSVYVNDVQNNPLQPDINYRGYSASPLLGTPQGMSVYLDGMRLNQPFGDVVSWDLIPTRAISSMTLMPGSNPVFGLNTLGGALSLKTKDGFTDPGYSVALGYGSRSRRQAEMEAGGHNDSGLYWYGTANKLQDDGWRVDSPTDAGQAFASLGWRNERSNVALHSAWADTDLNGNGMQDLQFLPGDRGSVYTKPDNTKNKAWLVNLTGSHKAGDAVTLSGNAHYRRIRTRTFNGDINDDALGEDVFLGAAGNATSAGVRDRNALAAAGYTGVPGGAETLATAPFPSWACISSILLNLAPNENCDGLANRTRMAQHDSGLSGQAAWNTSLAGRANLLAVGAALLGSRAHFVQSSEFGYLSAEHGVVTVPASVLAAFPYPYTYAIAAGQARTVTAPGNFADGSQSSEGVFDSRVDLTGKARTYSAYVSDSIALTPLVQVTVSGRFDHTRIDSDDGITPGDEAGTLTAKHHFSRFNPAIGVTVQPIEGLSAYLGYSQGSRAPSAIELGCADPGNPCRLPNAMAGDPPLDQVVTNTLEAGVRGRAGGLGWNVGVFRAENRHDIMFVAEDTSGFGYFRNFGRTRRQGVELGATGRIGPLTFGANYTRLDATYRSGEKLLGAGNSANDEGPGFGGTIEIEPGNRIPLTPRHMGKAFVAWQILPRMSASLDLLSIDRSYARGNENNRHEPDGTYYLGRGYAGGYTVFNLGAEYRPIDAVSVFAQVNNLFDKQYYTAAQLGSTAFNAAGSFVARPFAGPLVEGERPLLGSTFYSPGAPRAFWFGARYSFGR
jgi:outer membrane receptor protein involved in Fe transport